MDLDDALAALGLARDATWLEIRAAYRTRIRAVHPDVATNASNAPAGADAARLNAAFAALEPLYRRGIAPPPVASPQPRVEPSHPPVDLERVDDDALALVAPPDEVFLRLATAIDEIGDITYTDPDLGYLEAVVADGRAQLVVSLQGRAHATEAFFTLEPMDTRAVPAIDTIVRQIAWRLRQQAPS